MGKRETPAAQAQRLRRMCGQLPEAAVVEHDRHTGFEVRGKKFAWHVVDDHGDGRISFQCRAPKGENVALAAADPDRFFLPKYMAHHGWIGLWLDRGDVDWEEVAELLTDAYLLAAPKRLAALVTAPSPD